MTFKHSAFEDDSANKRLKVTQRVLSTQQRARSSLTSIQLCSVVREFRIAIYDEVATGVTNSTYGEISRRKWH